MFVTEPNSEKDFELYFDLRWRILRKPWNQPKGSENDELEKKSIHAMVCKEDRIPIGVGRLHFNSNEEAQIRSMAVEEEYRGKGIGSMILFYLEDKAREKNAKSIILSARKTALKFYENNGYKIVEEGHTLFGVIPHYKMKKIL
ncbi:MAG TPA: GNAT family N-acetyltransferase [Ignavibacteriaceae bacterium]|nr:GNAT family N-acetyltransferase [Ignavibacteriaceae bacterium]